MYEYYTTDSQKSRYWDVERLDDQQKGWLKIMYFSRVQDFIYFWW